MMKPENRLFIRLAVASVLPFLAAIAMLRPTAPVIAGLTACSALSIFIARFFLAERLSQHRKTEKALRNKVSETPIRITDVDNLVQQLVPAVEDFMGEFSVKSDFKDDTRLQRELRQRLTRVVEQSMGISPGGETREVTVLLSDLRGFSVITESLSPPQVVDMLNRYFDYMCEIIYKNGGTIDKFMGDCIMVLFGAPESRHDDIERALCCAVEMQIAMDRLNKENETFGLPHLYMGIGVNTGKVIAGKIGSDLHSEYTVIGEEVNLASRIEAYTLRGQILISENTYEKAKDLVFVKEPIKVNVKGREEPVSLYELKGVAEPYNFKVPEREARRSLRVDVNIPFSFHVCEGKVIHSENFEGRILNISYGGMLACTPTEVKPFDNIKFRLDVHVLGLDSGDIFAKILRVKRKEALYELNLEFTGISPRDHKAIGQMIDQVVQGRF